MLKLHLHLQIKKLKSIEMSIWKSTSFVCEFTRKDCIEFQAPSMSNLGLGMSYYDRWLEAQKASVSLLREALDQQKPEQELLPLVQTCYAQYKERVDAKIRAIQEDASLVASAAWKSPLEAGFLWVGGWRPTTAVVLAYSLMGMQIESELWKILEGMDVPSMAALSARQLLRLNSLHMQNRVAEDDLSDRLALFQMLVADQQMVKATTVDPPPSETNDLSEVREAMEPKLASLRDLTVEAEQLRSQTVQEMLNILTATQAAQLIVAAFEMFLAVKKLGEDQYVLDSGGSDEINLKRAANVTELASQGDFSKLQESLKHGADPSVVDYDGRTPLHVAAEKGHVDCVALLIKAGANVNKKDKFGKTALIGALKGGHDAVAQILVQSGAEAQMEVDSVVGFSLLLKYVQLELWMLLKTTWTFGPLFIINCLDLYVA
ncbi:hypothetical protein O6H91_13G020200 [Diphasiastrum complanatum]|uniref:Uncharacterized protein n=2 Tax=Diphasiastrum complanatum TaxID=34168 RepID=A0ACC2BSP9_DIPCM|nr:hypothetical protein O6H91_13G020200 [Diphasiastrum complanatum]KAJ7532788.1 hypothetical protein O6H91_13G020200 [Diphasiastrum complanatum]